MCEADWFCQFFLAGVSRRLCAEDREGARAIMALFDLPEIRTLEFFSVCRLARAAANVLVAMPPRLSGVIARRLQYHGAWSRWLQRVGTMRPMPEAEWSRNSLNRLAPRRPHRGRRKICESAVQQSSSQQSAGNNLSTFCGAARHMRLVNSGSGSGR